MSEEERIQPEELEILEERPQKEEEEEERELETALDYPETPAADPTHDYQAVNKAFVDALEVTLKAYADTAEVDAKAYADTQVATLNLVYSSDTQKDSDDTEETNDNASYTKVKEIEVSVNGRIKTTFDMKQAGGPTATIAGKIYVNGSAVGAEHLSESTTYATYEDTDISVESGDLVQLYMKSVDSPQSQTCRNFRVYWDVGIKGYVDTVAPMPSYFGDGSDGDVTIDSNTTLTANKYYKNLTITNSAVLTTDGYKIYVSGILKIYAGCTIRANGSAGSNGQSGDAGAAGGAGGAGSGGNVLTAGRTGTDGGNGGNNDSGSQGENGGDVTSVLGSAGIQGATGGAAGARGGGLGGVLGSRTYAYSPPFSPAQMLAAIDIWTTPAKYEVSTSSTGGGGGAAAGVSGVGGGGGGAGGSGGIIAIYARIIINDGTIEAKGGAGGDGGAGGTGGDGNNGGGGAGAGGNGGLVFLLYQNKETEGTITLTGGAGGTGGTGAGTGSNGGNGTAGATGELFEVQV